MKKNFKGKRASLFVRSVSDEEKNVLWDCHQEEEDSEREEDADRKTDLQRNVIENELKL